MDALTRLLVLIGLALFLAGAPLDAASASADDASPALVQPLAPVDIEVFTRPGCPHCDEAKAFLAELRAERPELVVRVHDVAADRDARDRLYELAEEHGIELVGVPALVIDGEMIVGFRGDGSTAARVRDGLVTTGVFDEVCTEEIPCDDAETAARQVDVPVLGTLDVRRLGLPVFTVLIGLVDGFNPCATWVLLFVLSLLVNLKDRTRMLMVGGTFVLVSGLVYFAFMAAWLNLFWLLGVTRWVQVVLGLVALGVGAINVKDFFAFKKGVTLSIPDSAKPGIAARAKAILRAESIPAALIAAATLAVLVNVVELLCTAGLPAVYTQVLTQQELPSAGHYGYLALYNLAYMLDDGMLLTVAVVTLSKRRLQEGGGRALKLVSGVVMLALALMLLFVPSWLVW